MTEPHDLVQFLRTGFPRFSGFTDARLERLVAGSRVASFEEHEMLAHHEADATHFGVILSGTVGTSVLGKGGERQYLGRLETGETGNPAILVYASPAVSPP